MSSADWQGFAEMTGGVSGALTGLLFVAVSINTDRIGGHNGLRASAAQTLLLFIAPLITAATLLAPGQPDWVIGTELIAIGLVTSLCLLNIRRVRQALDDDEQLLMAIFNRPSVNILIMLLFVASGIVVACGQNAGLYLLLPVIALSQVSGVLNAWYFLLPPARPRSGRSGSGDDGASPGGLPVRPVLAGRRKRAGRPPREPSPRSG